MKIILVMMIVFFTGCVKIVPEPGCCDCYKDGHRAAEWLCDDTNDTYYTSFGVSNIQPILGHSYAITESKNKARYNLKLSLNKEYIFIGDKTKSSKLLGEAKLLRLWHDIKVQKLYIQVGVEKLKIDIYLKAK